VSASATFRDHQGAANAPLSAGCAWGAVLQGLVRIDARRLQRRGQSEGETDQRGDA